MYPILSKARIGTRIVSNLSSVGYSRLIYGIVKILHLYGIITIPVYAGFFVVSNKDNYEFFIDGWF